MSSVQHVER
jgi:hypothetical protein